MRLIDADAKELKQRININFGAVTRFIVKSILKDAPTIDAVPVVRCKDCNRGKTAVEGDSVWCCCYQMEMELDNFCKNGGEADE